MRKPRSKLRSPQTKKYLAYEKETVTDNIRQRALRRERKKTNKKYRRDVKHLIKLEEYRKLEDLERDALPDIKTSKNLLTAVFEKRVAALFRLRFSELCLDTF